MSPGGDKWPAEVRCFYRLRRCRQLTLHCLEGGQQRLRRWFCGVVDGCPGLTLGCRAPLALKLGTNLDQSGTV